MSKSVLLSHNIIIFLIGVLLGIGIHIMIKACTEKSQHMLYQKNDNNSFHLNRIIVQEELVEPIKIQEEIPVIENKRISESDEQACDTTTCLDKAINFKLKDWEDDLKKRIHCLQSVREVCKIDYSINPKDSDSLLLKNVIFDTEKQFLYLNNQQEIDRIHILFPYISTSLQIQDKQQEMYKWSTTQPWLVLLPTPSNTSSMEIISIAFHLLHSFLYPSSLPSKSDILLPSLDNADVDYPYALFPMISTSFDKSIQVYYSNQIKQKGRLIHFSSLLLLGQYHKQGVTSITQHPFDSDFVRGLAYKHYLKYKEVYSKRSSQTARAWYLTRCSINEPKRQINEDALKYAQRKIRGKIQINKDEITSLSLSTLVKQLVQTDIIIAVSGSPITLAVFMLPQSAVMEIVPKFEKHAIYHHFVIALNHFHYVHYQIQTSYFDNNQDGNSIGYVDNNALWIYLQDLVNMVLHNKYHIFYVFMKQTMKI